MRGTFHCDNFITDNYKSQGGYKKILLKANVCHQVK